jgi:hypothetical protein
MKQPQRSKQLMKTQKQSKRTEVRVNERTEAKQPKRTKNETTTEDSGLKQSKRRDAKIKEDRG